MNVANSFPDPISTFVVDLPANQYKDFELEPDSTYPLAGVTYQVDYGYLPGYTAEDGHELDFFVGEEANGEMGYLVVDRGENTPDEHKFYVGLSKAEVSQILDELAPVLIKNESFESVADLLTPIAKFKDKP